MRLDLFNNISSVASIIIAIFLYFYFSKKFTFGGLSMPCVVILTSIVYYYVMPLVMLSDYDAGHVGLYIESMEWMHFASILYILGSTLAFLFFSRTLGAKITYKYNDVAMDEIVYRGLWVLSGLVVMYLATAGRLNVFGASDYVMNSEDNFKLLNNLYNILIPLTIIFMIRNKFNILSFIVICAVSLLFIQIGFRFRLLILLAAAVSSYSVVKRWHFGTSITIFGSVLAIFIVNLVGSIRQYSKGVDLSRLTDTSFTSILGSFSGEIGPVYVFANTANGSLPEPITFEPWIVGFVRLIPSAMWPNKPTASYLAYFTSGSIVQNADQAGLAAPQHVEMLLQFGWLGLPLLAFLYFGSAAFLVKKIQGLGYEARIAGCAIAPAFFGFYMQTRGYFFQILADGIFIFGPLFLLHIRNVRSLRPPYPGIYYAGPPRDLLRR